MRDDTLAGFFKQKKIFSTFVEHGVEQVALLPCSERQVALSEPASEQLKPSSEQPEKNMEPRGFAVNNNASNEEFQVALIALKFTVDEVARLAGVSKQSIKAAISKKRIDVQEIVADSGKHKGRKKYLIPADSAFRAYPQAKAAWDAQNQLAINKSEQQDAALEARKGDAASVAALKDWQRRGMDARIGVLRHIEMMAAGGVGLEVAIAQFIADASRGALPVEVRGFLEAANARKGEGRLLSRRTIYRWMAEAKKGGGGNAALAPMGMPFIEPRWAWPHVRLPSQPRQGGPQKRRAGHPGRPA